MATILMPLPARDFDPSETAIPWRMLSRRHRIVFATPDGKKATADPRTLTGKGFGPLAPVLMARKDAIKAYRAMEQDPAFSQPLSYAQIRAEEVDAVFLPGGHAQGMKPYLESGEVQRLVVAMDAKRKPIAAVCHGVLVAARAIRADGQSVLYGKRTTALTESLENTAWNLTRLWLGNYYRTYPLSVQDEVTQALASPKDFKRGPLLSISRDREDNYAAGFVVEDGHYLSTRWPGDVYTLAACLNALLDK